MKIWFIVILFVGLLVAGYLSISLLNGVNTDGVLDVSKIQANIGKWNPHLIHFYISSAITAPIICAIIANTILLIYLESHRLQQNRIAYLLHPFLDHTDYHVYHDVDHLPIYLRESHLQNV